MSARAWTRPTSLGALARWEGLATLAVVALAFALRALFVWDYRTFPLASAPAMDELYHLEWARAFARGERFVEGPYFRAPLYPWFLGALIERLGENLLWLRWVQSALGAVATWLVIRLARRAFSPAAGIAAGLCYATLWISIFYDSQLLLESLAIPLYLAGLVSVLRSLDSSRASWPLLGGLLLGLGAITRPNVLLVVPPLCLGWLLVRRPAAALLCLIGLALPIAPITWRNWQVGGEAVLISTQAGVNLWIGNNPRSDGVTAVVPGTREDWWGGYDDAVQLARRESGQPLDASGVSRFYVDKTLAFARAEPLAYLRLLATKLRWLFSDVELPNNEEPRFVARASAPWIATLPLGTGFLWVAAALGLFGARAEGKRHWPLAVFLGAYALSVVLFFVNARFRLPLLPLLCIYAGTLFARLIDRARARQWKPLATSALFLCAGTLVTQIGSAQALRRGDANGWLMLGQAQARAGDGQAAGASLRRSVELVAGNPIAWRALGSNLLLQGDALAGQDALEEALRLAPTDVIALEMLGDSLLATNRYERIEAIAQRLERAAPDSGQADYLRGRAAHAAGALDAARAAYERAFARDASEWRAAYALGVLLENDGESAAARAAWTGARAALEQRLRRDSSDAQANKYLADIRARLDG